jgi:hypothetical protein
VAAEAGVNEAGGRMCQQAQASQRGFALQSPGQVVGQRAGLQRGAEHELAGMQHERLPFIRFHQAGELILLLCGVDVGVPGVIENPEQTVETNVDAGRLHQGVVEGINSQPPGGNFGSEVAIGEQHATSVAAPPAPAMLMNDAAGGPTGSAMPPFGPFRFSGTRSATKSVLPSLSATTSIAVSIASSLSIMSGAPHGRRSTEQTNAREIPISPPSQVEIRSDNSRAIRVASELKRNIDMKFMRITTLAAVAAGAAVGLATPASAELVDGTYNRNAVGGPRGPGEEHPTTVVITSCGAGCKHVEYPGTNVPPEDYRLSGNIWTYENPDRKIIETIDNDTLATTLGSTAANFGLVMHGQLVKAG